MAAHFNVHRGKELDVGRIGGAKFLNGVEQRSREGGLVWSTTSRPLQFEDEPVLHVKKHSRKELSL